MIEPSMPGPLKSDLPAPPLSSVVELLRVLQFGDSVLPVGAFSFSGGLESAVQEGIVSDRDSLQQFVRTATRQAATGDGIALLHAHRAARAAGLPQILDIDRAVVNRKLNEEVRTMTTRMGRKLAELCERVRPNPLMAGWLAAIRDSETPGSFPVAQALAFAGLGLGEPDAFAAHQYGVASMLTGAALRLMRLDHLDAQVILYRVNAAAAEDHADIHDATLDDMQSFAPEIEIAASTHLQAKVRMFMA
jgi:urease accessory protein